MEGLALIPGLYTYAATAIVAGAAAWFFQDNRYTAELAELRLEQTTANIKRSEAARADEIQTALKESTHAANTSKNADEFTTSQPARDAIARADLARVDRLRIGAERRAATYRAQASSCAAASSGIADRLEALDAHIVRGAGVVAGLGADLERRDAEIVLLRGQIDADRELMVAPRDDDGPLPRID